MKFKTQFNAVPDKGRVFLGKSMTIPDQCMSIREIVARYQRGLPINAKMHKPIYDDTDLDDPEDVIPDPRSLDLSELAAMRDENEARIRDYQERESRRKDEQRKKRDRETYFAEFKKEADEKEQKSKNDTVGIIPRVDQ